MAARLDDKTRRKEKNGVNWTHYLSVQKLVYCINYDRDARDLHDFKISIVDICKETELQEVKRERCV